MPDHHFEVACGGATSTDRSDAAASQDRHGTHVGGQAVAIAVACDGVGSLSESGPVAEAVCDAALAHLSTSGDDGALGLIESVAETMRGAPAVDGATTLLAVLACGNGVVHMAWCGNGSILEIAIDDDGRPTWIDHVIPHTNAREQLTASLRPGAAAPVGSVAAIVVPADSARLLVACTDGISSRETVSIGTAPDGSAWASVPVPVVRMVDAVRAAWPDLVSVDIEKLGDRLDTLLAGTLGGLAQDQVLEDDATAVAVMIRPKPAPA